MHSLTRRERQIMELLFRLGPLTAVQIRDGIPDAPSYSGVRGLLRVLLNKGHVSHSLQGLKYVYRAAAPRQQTRDSAVAHLVETYFQGSVVDAVAALLALSSTELSERDLANLERLINGIRSTGQCGFS
jgi:predicted transcriptional regulator